MLCGRGLDSSGDVLVYTRNLASLARDIGVDIRWGATGGHNSCGYLISYYVGQM